MFKVSYSISSQGLGSFVDFCCQGPALRGIKKVDKISVRISLTFEASEMNLSLHMIFNLERALCAILERISGLDPSLEMTAPRYLKFFTSSSLWPFILISLWKLLGCLSSLLSCLGRSPFLPYDGCIETAYQDASFFFLFCISTMSSAKRKLVISRPPMLTLHSIKILTD